MPTRTALRIYAVVALVLTCVLLLHGLLAYERVSRTLPYDGNIDWGGARVILDGGDPYSPEGLRSFGLNPIQGLGHPPTTLVWFLPLARLDPIGMKLVWNEFTLLCLFLHLLILVRELRFPLLYVTVPLLFSAVLSTSWMTDHLSAVQLSGPIAFLYTLAWCCLRHDEDVAAGLFLGLACTLKFYPATVVLLLLLSGRLRVVLAAAAMWAAFAVPITLRLGPLCWRRFLAQTEWYTHVWTGHIRNESLQGILQRLHAPSCVTRPGYHELWKPGVVLASVLSLLLIALCTWLSRRAAQEDRALGLPFALFTVVSMITGPYAWEHYNITLILPLLVATTALWRARCAGLSPARALLLGGALLGVVIMLGISMHVKNNLWHNYPKFPAHLRLHLFEVLGWLPSPLLIVVLGLLLRHGRSVAGEVS